MQKFKTALFGTGFVGRVHLEGIRRLGYVELYAIGEPQIEKAKQLAAEFGVQRTEALEMASAKRSTRACEPTGVAVVTYSSMTARRIACVRGSSGPMGRRVRRATAGFSFRQANGPPPWPVISCR